MLAESKPLRKSKYNKMYRTDNNWSNREVSMLFKYKDQLF